MTRIVAWNCNEALDRKTGALLALRARHRHRQ